MGGRADEEIGSSLRSNGGMGAETGGVMGSGIDNERIGFSLRENRELRIMGASGIAVREIYVLWKKETQG